MDTDTARAILSEAAAGDYFNGALPDTDEEIVELAKYFVNEAELYVAEENPTDAHIDAIINLSVSPPVLSATAEHTNDGVPPGEFASDKLGGFAPGTTYEEVAKTHPRRSSGGYSESDLREYEGLPLPRRVEENVPENMPTDLTELGDKAVRKLYSAFGAYLNRARWNLAGAESNLANATHLRDEAFRTAYVAEHRKAQVAEEKLSQATLENLAKDTAQYKEWNERIREHSAEVTSWKALVSIYGGNVERLSREWTMRTEEYERSR